MRARVQAAIDELDYHPNGFARGLRKRHVRHVVGAARVQGSALVVVDGVIGRCDEIGQRAGRAGVADGAERLNVGHRGERTNGPAP